MTRKGRGRYGGGLHLNTDDFALDGLFMHNNPKVPRSPIPLSHRTIAANPMYQTVENNRSRPVNDDYTPAYRPMQEKGAQSFSPKGHQRKRRKRSFWKCGCCSSTPVSEPSSQREFDRTSETTGSFDFYNASGNASYNSYPSSESMGSNHRGFAPIPENNAPGTARHFPSYNSHPSSESMGGNHRGFAPIPESNAPGTARHFPSYNSQASSQSIRSNHRGFPASQENMAPSYPRARKPSYQLNTSFDSRGPAPRPTSMSTFVGKFADPVRSAYNRISGRGFSPGQMSSGFGAYGAASSRNGSSSGARSSNRQSIRNSIRNALSRGAPPRPTSHAQARYRPSPPPLPRGVMGNTVRELQQACEEVLNQVATGVTPHALENLARTIDIAKARGMSVKNGELKHAINLEKRMRAQLIAQRSIQQAMEKEDFKMLKRVLKRAKKEGVNIEIRFDRQEDRDRARNSTRRSYMRSMRVPFAM